MLEESVLRRGILVAVEGIDGAGKTTQVDLMCGALMRAGEFVVRSKEPTNGQWGSVLRRSASTGRLPLDEELQTFIKDRTEHVDKLINPNRDAGAIVILDRYFYSTIAYQGARGADAPAVQAEMLRLFPRPDAVFLLDVDPIVGINRIANDRCEKPNHFEERGSLAAARSIFSQMQDDNIHKIDGHLPIDVVHERIMSLFIAGPLKEKRCAKEYGCGDPFHCSFRHSGMCEWWSLKSNLGAHEAASLIK